MTGMLLINQCDRPGIKPWRSEVLLWGGGDNRFNLDCSKQSTNCNVPLSHQRVEIQTSCQFIAQDQSLKSGFCSSSGYEGISVRSSFNHLAFSTNIVQVPVCNSSPKEIVIYSCISVWFQFKVFDRCAIK